MLGITWPAYAGERRFFVGIPPREGYAPGEVHLLANLGLTEDEARVLVRNTTLEIVEVEGAAEPVITPEEASAAASTLSRSDEVASEAGKTLAEFERQKRPSKKPAKSAEKEG